MPKDKSNIEMITKEEVRKLFDYDPVTGLLTRKEACYRAQKGLVLNINSQGYLQVGIKGKNYGVHRIVWLHQYGTLPKGYIDHINGYRSDNRLTNLRDVTLNENNRNLQLNRINKTGVKGVSWLKHDFRWRAQINKNSKVINLGQFEDFYEAVAHRLAAEQCIDWNSFKHTSSALTYLNDYLYTFTDEHLV